MHYEKYRFYFISNQQALERIESLNSIFCQDLNLCASNSCACEIGKGSRVCTTYQINSAFRPIFLNEGPDWSLLYVVDDKELHLYVHYYGPKVELEWIHLLRDLSAFQREESLLITKQNETNSEVTNE